MHSVDLRKWLQGPSFLWTKELVSEDVQDYEIFLVDNPELKKAHTLVVLQEFDLTDRLRHLSDWHKARKAVALCLRLKNDMKAHRVKMRSTRKPGSVKPLSTQEISDAEKEIFRSIQRSAYPQELDNLQKNESLPRNSKLSRLDPFLKDGIIHIGGLIRYSGLDFTEKHPAVLPSKNDISKMIIYHFHTKVGHQGRGMTINGIRSNGLWIQGCSSTVSYMISKCVICRRLRSAVQNQKMSDLPEDRITPSAPFTYVGVDYFGPFLVKQGRQHINQYGVVFTCLASQAIHLEVAMSLDTSAFINALRRLISIRGPIRELRSDRGTNFVGAARELKEAISELDDTEIQKYLLKEGGVGESGL